MDSGGTAWACIERVSNCVNQYKCRLFFCHNCHYHRFDWNEGIKPNSKFNQKNSPLESRLICTPCLWTQSLLQTISPWLLPLPLWLYHVSCRAQTPMPAMGLAPRLFLRSAPLKLTRPPPPSRPITGSSNRRNTRTASRWTKRDGERLQETYVDSPKDGWTLCWHT